MSVRILAIDPGLTGAIAALHGYMLLEVRDIPTWQVGSKTIIDARQFHTMLHTMVKLHDITVIVLEAQNPMPNQGVVSVFSLGRTYGQIEAVSYMEQLPVEYVMPSVWKRKAGLTGKKKHASLELARELWPDQEMYWPLIKHHNRADAALIGRFYEVPTP